MARRTLTELAAEFGIYATFTYVGTSLLVGAPTYLLLTAGVDLGVEVQAGTWGALAAVWVVLKLTQLPRLAATAALTPLVASYGRRVFGQPAAREEAEAGEPPAGPEAPAGDPG